MTDPSVVLSVSIGVASVEDDNGQQQVITLDLDSTDISTAHLEHAPVTRTSYAIPHDLAVQVAHGILQVAEE